jgi:flagellar biosynthesis protein FlhF
LTPGQARDIYAGDGLAAFLRSADIDTHLTNGFHETCRSDVRWIGKKIPAGEAVVHHVDETSSPGSMLSEAVRAAKPISFITNGQQIPEDLREATTEYLTGLVLGDLSRKIPLEETTTDSSGVLEKAWKSSAGSCAAAA